MTVVSASATDETSVLHVARELRESDKRRRLAVGMAPLRTLVAPSEELPIANEPSSGCPGRVLVPLGTLQHLRGAN